MSQKQHPVDRRLGLDTTRALNEAGASVAVDSHYPDRAAVAGIERVETGVFAATNSLLAELGGVHPKNNDTDLRSWRRWSKGPSSRPRPDGVRRHHLQSETGNEYVVSDH